MCSGAGGTEVRVAGHGSASPTLAPTCISQSWDEDYRPNTHSRRLWTNRSSATGEWTTRASLTIVSAC